MRPRLLPLGTFSALMLVAACGDDSAPATADAAVADAEVWSDARTECPDPDAAALPTCDLFLGCGCDLATQKCTPAVDGPKCVTAGAHVVGELCSGESDCVAGATCVFYAGDMRCMGLCDPAHPCASVDQSCYIKITDGDDPPGEIGRVCGQVCSLLDQDCAYDTQGCYESMTWAPTPEKGICLTAGLSTQGEHCAHAADCAEGYLCITPSGATTSVCAKICSRMGTEPSCDEGTCQQLSGEVETGICLVAS